jgi:tetratricopeptide (TPR) repeat protein
MIKLKSVLMQMKNEEYALLLTQLRQKKAGKFATLATLLRENEVSEEDIMKKLDVNSSAYYTLKSRLYERIGDFLSAGLDGSRTDILKQVATIPELVYNSQKDTAVAVLSKLEKDLISHDMPYELSSVYNALKKLHISSPKYYEYAQLYNRHVAYTIALDKAEDTLAAFIKALGDYYVSRNSSTHEVMKVMKDEMGSLCRLYDSHHLTVYGNILDVLFALFIPFSEAVKNDPPVEDILASAEKIMAAYPNDSTYKYLRQAVAFLRFEYYHQAGQYKKADQYFDQVNGSFPQFLNYTFCSFPSVFLLSKAERYVRNGKAAQLHQENNELFKDVQADTDDVPGYVNYTKYMAASLFFAGKYGEAATLLNNLLNEVVFKNMTHSELEVKLFFVLCCSMQNKYDTAHTVLRSVLRKVRELENKHEYENVNAFGKMLSIQLDSGIKDKEKKLLEQRDRFILLNRGRAQMLTYLDLGDEFVKKLAREVK